MKKSIVKYAILTIISFVGLNSCQSMFEFDSNQVLFADENALNSPSDSVFSVIGVIGQMQKIADRSMLLGEIRGDLVTLNQSATLDLQALANFTAGTNNKYNAPEDYYSIINNCNFFIANADTAVKKRNASILLKDYVAIKVFRAWTYLQLAQIYGSVPFITEPILAEKETVKNHPMKNIQEISDYFIEDLTPFINVQTPLYGTVGGMNSQTFYIPIRALLGDLCLWSGRYLEAANYYHDYLTSVTKLVSTSKVSWPANTTSFEGRPSNSYTSIIGSTNETMTIIPMESNTYDGLMSDVRDIYNSTLNNYYFNQATYSNGYKELSRQQVYCKVYQRADLSYDTIYAPTTNSDDDLYVGDLRLSTLYTKDQVNSSSSSYSNERYTNVKVSRNVTIYRTSQIYLRYAEALNRAGYPTAAFATLKYGLTSRTIGKYVDSTEVAKATGTNLLYWPDPTFNAEASPNPDDKRPRNTIGIHSRGTGRADANKFYVIPSLPSKIDTILFVEEKICDEMALETSFEGTRLYDLIRMAMRRNDNSFLADKIAKRKGSAHIDADLQNRLVTDRKNWYLPLE